MDIFIEVFGWYGAVAIVVAYFLNSFNILKSELIYQLLNLTGAMGVGVLSLYKEVYPSVGLNVVWFGIALTALVKLGMKQGEGK